jgi:hypothetical protein
VIIRINGFDSASVKAAISQLRALKDNSRKKANEACLRLAEYGAKYAAAEFNSAGIRYDGTNDVTVVAEPTETGARVRASGEAVLFLEYGAGATMGYGHPRPMGYGPGTYPGKGHWNDPKGWFYEHGKRSFGNPPTAAMYHAEQQMLDHAYEIASKVFDK